MKHHRARSRCGKVWSEVGMMEPRSASFNYPGMGPTRWVAAPKPTARSDRAEFWLRKRRERFQEHPAPPAALSPRRTYGPSHAIRDITSGDNQRVRVLLRHVPLLKGEPRSPAPGPDRCTGTSTLALIFGSPKVPNVHPSSPKFIPKPAFFPSSGGTCLPPKPSL